YWHNYSRRLVICFILVRLLFATRPKFFWMSAHMMARLLQSIRTDWLRAKARAEANSIDFAQNYSGLGRMFLDVPVRTCSEHLLISSTITLPSRKYARPEQSRPRQYRRAHH